MNRFLLLLFTLSLSAPALTTQEPPTAAPDLRNAYGSLTALPGIPDAFKVNFFDDPEVLLRSITVEPTSVPEEGSCQVRVRINNVLAKVLIVQPPGANPAGIQEPPSTIPPLTWKALLDRVGIVEPPTGIVLTPADGLTIILESDSGEEEDGLCAANVLVLGSVYTEELSSQITAISPSALRSEYVSLEATPNVPGEHQLSFTDPSVLVRSMDVIGTRKPKSASCTLRTRINELLVRLQYVQPPDAVKITEPPDAIVFTPNDVLKLSLEARLRNNGKDKDKGEEEEEEDALCAAEVLLLGTLYSNGL